MFNYLTHFYSDEYTVDKVKEYGERLTSLHPTVLRLLVEYTLLEIQNEFEYFVFSVEQMDTSTYSYNMLDIECVPNEEDNTASYLASDILKMLCIDHLHGDILCQAILAWAV